MQEHNIFLIIPNCLRQFEDLQYLSKISYDAFFLINNLQIKFIPRAVNASCDFKNLRSYLYKLLLTTWSIHLNNKKLRVLQMKDRMKGSNLSSWILMNREFGRKDNNQNGFLFHLMLQ